MGRKGGCHKGINYCPEVAQKYLHVGHLGTKLGQAKLLSFDRVGTSSVEELALLPF